MEKSVKQLFKDFVFNRCNAAELARVQELIKSGDFEAEWREVLDEVEPELIVADVTAVSLNEQQMLEDIRTQLQFSSQRKKNIPWKWLGLAATILLVSGLALLWLKPLTDRTDLQTSILKPAAAKKNTAHKWVKLPDGSSVQLNEDSYLEYAESFEGKALREVRLIGEGYFDIKHDAEHPFVIHTGKIKTTVLGTAFNIRAYQADQSVTVTVTRGKVKVEDEKRMLAVLTPDQQLAWNIKVPEAVKLKVNAAEVLEWKKLDLIMDDITLEEAGRMIAERYQVKIQFNNEKVKNCRFTAAFLNRNGLSQVLKVIAEITGASLTVQNDLVLIDGPGC